MHAIPSDVLVYLFDFFDAKTLVNFALSNHAMHNTVTLFLQSFQSLRRISNDHFNNFDLYHYHTIVRDSLMSQIFDYQTKEFLHIDDYVETYGVKMVAYILCEQIPCAKVWNETVFYLLAKIGRIDVMEEMLRVTTYRDWSHHCPISYLLHQDSSLMKSKENIYDMVKLMIHYGIRPVNAHITALYYAIPLRNEPLVRLLLENGCTQINGITPPLHFAARKGSLEIVKCMLEYILVPNNIDASGRTAMHYAARFVGYNSKEKMNIMMLLKEHGCDPTIRDHYGQTAIDMFHESIQNDKNTRRQEICTRFIEQHFCNCTTLL
jgi:hypothetical protein